MLNGIEEIEGLTPEQIEAINAKAKGLADKNAELLGKYNSTKTAAEAELEALKQFKSNAEIKAAEDAKNWEEATRLKEEAHAKELEKLTSQNSQNSELITKLLIDDGLNKALDGVKVNPTLKAGAEAMLRSTATIVDGKAMIGEKPLSEAVTEWAGSDAGKAFCLAEQNSGGDGNGGDKKPAKPEPQKNEQAEAARKKGDINGFLKAKMTPQSEKVTENE